MSQFVHDPGDISALQVDFASGASDPVVLVENLFRRADEVEPHVQAWLSLDRDNALRQAHACREEMRRGVRRGPVCTENLNPSVAVMKSAQKGV